VVEKETVFASEGERLAEELKQRALTSLGGSMVYMERTELTWDGEADAQSEK